MAAYLTGSLRSENPFLGNATDIDIVFVHAGEPKVRREIIALTPEIHLDIVHNPRSEYEKPKELRVHPWLGPELYDPLPLYGTQHFFEFVQAGVRAGYDEPVNVLARARRNADHARQIWSGLQFSQETGPALLLSYLKSINHAANAIALLTGVPLAERRFLLQFQERAAAAGAPGLAAGLTDLLGGDQVDGDALKTFLPDWGRTSSRHPAAPGIRPQLKTTTPWRIRVTPAGHTINWPSRPCWQVIPRSPSCGRWCIPGRYPRRSFHQLTRSQWKAACETLGLTGARLRRAPGRAGSFPGWRRGNPGQYGCQPGSVTLHRLLLQVVIIHQNCG